MESWPTPTVEEALAQADLLVRLGQGPGSRTRSDWACVALAAEVRRLNEGNAIDARLSTAADGSIAPVALQMRQTWVDPNRPVVGPKQTLSKIDLIVIHYPGVKPGALDLNNPVQVLRNTHQFYLNKKPTGYAIGYNFATFDSGAFELRGFDIVNAANLANDDGVNDNPHTLSINVMVNGADPATDNQVQHTRDLITKIWDVLGRKVPLIGHGAVPGANTACPGAGIRHQLDAGLFLPQIVKPQPQPETPRIDRPQEDDMIVITNSEDFFGNPPGKWKGVLKNEDGFPRHMKSAEWELRGMPEGVPQDNSQLSRLFAGE